eukprot:scaffold29487_cov131-Isochrysis_galbana.AAC.1
MADAASRAGHVQAAARAAGLSSWRWRPLAHPQAAHMMLARTAGGAASSAASSSSPGHGDAQAHSDGELGAGWLPGARASTVRRCHPGGHEGADPACCSWSSRACWPVWSDKSAVSSVRRSACHGSSVGSTGETCLHGRALPDGGEAPQASGGDGRGALSVGGAASRARCTERLGLPVR